MRIKIIKDGFPSPANNGKFFKKDDVVLLDAPFCEEAIEKGFAIRWFPEDEQAVAEKLARMEAEQKVNEVIKKTKSKK